MKEVFNQCKSFDVQIWSDLYKEAHGFRPKFDLSEYSAEELDELWVSTCNILDQVTSQEAIEKEEAFNKFQTRLEKMIADFDISMETAWRWLLQSEGLQEDYDFYGMEVISYHFGMHCDHCYDDKIKELVFGAKM